MALPIKHRHVNALAELQELLHLTDEELAFLLKTSHRTVARWVSGTFPDNNARLQDLQELIALAGKTLRSDALAEWFREPNRALGGFVPLNLAADPHGFQLLRNLLVQASYGLPL